MILRVYSLDDVLKIVRLYTGSILEGIRFGNSPATPVNVTITIVKHEKMNALNMLFLYIKYPADKSEITAISGSIISAGTLK